jgi:non-heme chloroperoxidase
LLGSGFVWYAAQLAAKAVLLGAVPPIMVKTPKNPGLPIEVFDGFRKSLVEDRAQFFLDLS